MENVNFDRYEWHDANILNIVIDRSDPGNYDRIEMSILWIDGNRSKVIFDECYHISMNLNFGIISEENIRNAFVSLDDEYINIIKDRWKESGENFDSLSCFCFETGSTASIIKIYSLKFEILGIIVT